MGLCDFQIALHSVLMMLFMMMMIFHRIPTFLEFVVQYITDGVHCMCNHFKVTDHSTGLAGYRGVYNVIQINWGPFCISKSSSCSRNAVPF